MDWFTWSWRFLLFASIGTTFSLLIYIRSDMEPTITFLHYIRQKFNEALDVSPKPMEKYINLRVVNYSTFPIMQKVDCVPLNLALHKELICVYDDKYDLVVSMAVKRRGGWEEKIFKTLYKLLDACPDCQFVDIGANIGVYTVTLASLGRSVVAVEPKYTNLLLLAMSIRLNKWENKVIIVTNPVSDVHENVTLWLNKDNPGATEVASKGNTMSPLSRHAFDNTFRKGPGDLPTIYLDDLIPLVSFKKAIMKVDIQGQEMKAFKKAAKLFDAVEITHVLMEWYGKNNLPLNDIRPLIDFFTNRSYIAHNINMTLLPSDLEGFRTWPYDIIWVRGR